MRSVSIPRLALGAVLALVAVACAQPVPSATPATEASAQAIPADVHSDGDHAVPAASDHADGDHADGDHADGDHADGDHGDHEESFWFGEPADPAEADRVIEIIANDDFTFTPDPIQVRVGEVVTLRVTNVGVLEHDFTLGDHQLQLDHDEEMAKMAETGMHMEHGDPNALTLEPGETVELTWRFTAPGLIEAGCHVPGHYAAGMRAAVEVRA